VLNIDEYFFSLRRSYLVVASEFHCFGALFVVPISTFRISTARSFGSGCRSCCVRHKKCLSGGRGVWGPRRGSPTACNTRNHAQEDVMGIPVLFGNYLQLGCQPTKIVGKHSSCQ
jgi:hypothetical protein